MLISLLLAATIVSGDSITGTVVDSAGAPISDAAITLVEAHRAARTGADGRFVFREIAAGEYTISARRLGYASLVQHARAGADVRLVLARTPFELEGMTVTGTAAPTDANHALLATSTLSADTLHRTPSISIAHALRQMPGVRALTTGSQIGKPVIRGLSGSRVLVLDEGARLEDYSWSEEDGPSVDAALADRIEVIRGPASVLYGSDAVGGVVNVLPRALPVAADGAVLHTWGDAYVASNNAEIGSALGAEGATGALGWRASGTARLGQNLHTPASELDNTNFFAINGEGAAQWITNGGAHRTNVRITHYGGEFHLLEATGPAGAQDAGPERKAGDDRLQLAHDWQLGTLRLEGRAQHEIHRLIEVADTGTAAPAAAIGYAAPKNEATTFDLLLQTTSANVMAHHAIGERLRGVVGMDGMTQHSDSRGPVTLVPDARVRSAGAYALEELAFAHWSVVAGARIDTRRTSSDTNAALGLPAVERSWTPGSGDVGIVLRPTEQFSLSVNAGRAWRAPTLFELFANGPNPAEGRWEAGDTTLDAERATTFDATARWSAGILRTEASAYRSRVNGFVYLTPTTDSINGLPVFRHVASDARLWGGEGLVQVAATRSLLLHARGDVSLGERIASSTPLPLMPPPRAAAGFTLHRTTFGGWQDASIGAEAEHVWRQTRLDSLDDPTAAYTLISASAGAQRMLFGHAVRLDLTVENAANVRYRDFLSRYKTFALEPGRNIVLRAHVGDR